MTVRSIVCDCFICKSLALYWWNRFYCRENCLIFGIWLNDVFAMATKTYRFRRPNAAVGVMQVLIAMVHVISGISSVCDRIGNLWFRLWSLQRSQIIFVRVGIVAHVNPASVVSVWILYMWLLVCSNLLMTLIRAVNYFILVMLSTTRNFITHNI